VIPKLRLPGEDAGPGRSWVERIENVPSSVTPVNGAVPVYDQVRLRIPGESPVEA
jgi:hypothetical protein